MRRFLLLPANKEVRDGLKVLRCNHFAQTDEMKPSQQCTSADSSRLRSYDIKSHVSQSYFTTEHHIKVDAGDGDVSRWSWGLRSSFPRN